MKRADDLRLAKSSSIAKIRLLGKRCEILYGNQTFAGIIWRETKHTLQIQTPNGIKTFPKQQIVIRITYNDHTYEIAGKVMKGRPEDRIKTWMKRQW
ncbi:MAG: ribonuclease P protein subunit [Candidatus Heimdallarchaeota archaeon]